MTEKLLELENLVKEFKVGGERFPAVQDVSLTLRRQDSIAIVGESGSGKSTTARMAIGLETPTSGSVSINGVTASDAPDLFRRQVWENVSMVFQDPYNSLNPRMSIARNVEEPLLIHKQGSKHERAAKVDGLFEAVGLRPEMGGRRPRNLSGGQRQRVAIARALALDPELIILDEPVSALDVSIQAQVLNLLADLRENRRLSYLFISHDLAVVRHVAERTVVMYRGRVVEQGPTESVLGNPKHPYTAELVAAAMDLHSVGTEQSNGAGRTTVEAASTRSKQPDADHWVADFDRDEPFAKTQR